MITRVQPCDECGAVGRAKQPRPGAWMLCGRCRKSRAGSRAPVSPKPFGGAPLAPPADRGAAAYRAACYDAGYTLRNAATRARRDALHTAWTRWMRLIVLEIDPESEYGTYVRDQRGNPVADWQIVPTGREQRWLARNRSVLVALSDARSRMGPGRTDGTRRMASFVADAGAC